jgi:ABC-type multidrug transport system fused ATPase/permease subunit
VDWGDYLRRAIKAATRYVWLVDYARQATSSLTPDGEDPLPAPERLFRGIDLVNVTFHYPGTAPDGPPVLANVNLHLPAGKMVALVGENGAGKTSIVKLLSRFYEPSEGEILLDGAPLRRFDIDAWRARLSAGFQDFARLQFMAAESVGAGNLPKIGDRVAIRRAIELGGAAEVVAALPAGLETQLGKQWDGGAELSGGQWQKVALARAAMRWEPETHPLVILFDEPTAALDAQTEYALFERMAEAARSGEARGAVTLVVSHRFSTVRMADLIVVIEKGRVVESGSHEELMGIGGLYAELYSLQAHAYR